MREYQTSRFRAVIFDLDGVITNTMPYHFDAWLRIFAETGIKVNCYDVYEREGQRGLLTILEIFAKHGRKISKKEARRLLLRKESLFKKIVKARFIKGSRPFVRELKKHGFLLALVTGTSRHEVKKILPAGFLRIFDVTITGDEVRRGKPDPEPFLKAFSALRIKPKEAVVIENAPFGIDSAKRAGAFCIALETSLPHRYLRDADIVLKSFTSLRKYLHFD